VLKTLSSITDGSDSLIYVAASNGVVMYETPRADFLGNVCGVAGPKKRSDNVHLYVQRQAVLCSII
jgi:hypothetical protein